MLWGHIFIYTYCYDKYLHRILQPEIDNFKKSFDIFRANIEGITLILEFLVIFVSSISNILYK